MKLNYLKSPLILCMLLCCQPYAYAEQTTQHSTAEQRQLQSILKPFENINSVHLYYHEIRGSKFFLKPQQSSGEIIFKRNGYLSKQVNTPEKIKFVIKNNTFQFYSYLNEGIEKSGPLIPLTNHPEMTRFYDLTANLLKGNTDFIEYNYDYNIQVQDPYWLLKLQPKIADGFLDKKQPVVKDITIKGHRSLAHNNEIISIQTNGFGGEYSNLYVDQIISKTLLNQTSSSETITPKAVTTETIPPENWNNKQ